MELEDRVRILEATVNAMEERRRRLIPAELDSNPAVRTVLPDSLGAFTQKLQMFAEQKVVDEAVTRFNAARTAAFEEFERQAREGEQKELAELVAAIEYYERTGQSPPGYDISG